MKKLLLATIALFVIALSANAQVKIESPHPDLSVKITRCAYASGTVVIDMVITNYGMDEDLLFQSGLIHARYISMYDDEGNSYNSDNSDMYFGFPNKGLGLSAGGVFPQDVPLKFRFQFSNISPNASKFTLVKIGISSRGAMGLSVDRPLVIRNLEWLK